MTPPVPSPADREEAQACFKDIGVYGATFFPDATATFDAVLTSIASALARARRAGAEAERERGAERETARRRVLVTARRLRDATRNHGLDDEDMREAWRSVDAALNAMDDAALAAAERAAVVGARPAPEGAEGTR